MSSDNPFEAFRYGGSTANAHGSLHSERKRPASPARGGSAAADDASSPANRTKDAAGESAQGSPAKAARKNKGKPAPKARLCEPPAVKNFDGWLPVYERGPAGAGDAEILPFVSGVPGGWRERWCGVCDDCFEKGRQCFEYPELPLRMLIVGHNPSVKTWEVGVAYGNPSNRFWGLLRSSGILPAEWRPDERLSVINNRMPYELGIGISDLGCLPGSDAASFGGDIMRIWRDDFYRRVHAHVRRVHVSQDRTKDEQEVKVEDAAAERERERERAGASGTQGWGYPSIVAFTGKRHFAALFDPPLKRVQNFGPQPLHLRPPAWPFPESSEVWILPSPSGRAAMTAAEREAPYVQLGKRLASIPWHVSP
eukprot:Tamp_14223.p1 GENE.Tamp_14223~~Tamp_14223.p1  ORF type:complete len:404 (+),score=53.22 Tamp_14223:112-1212(+)